MAIFWSFCSAYKSSRYFAFIVAGIVWVHSPLFLSGPTLPIVRQLIVPGQLAGRAGIDLVSSFDLDSRRALVDF